MSEHLTKTQIEDYGRQTVSAAEFLSASRHLRDCEACRLKVERVLGDDGVFYALKSEVFSASAETVSSSSEHVHLTFELTAAYVDEALSGEELQLVKDHLTGCEQCAMAVDDLRAFRNRVMPGLDREYHPPHVEGTPFAPICRGCAISYTEVSRAGRIFPGRSAIYFIEVSSAGRRVRSGGALNDCRWLDDLGHYTTLREGPEDWANDSLANHTGCFAQSDARRLCGHRSAQ